MRKFIRYDFINITFGFCCMFSVLIIINIIFPSLVPWYLYLVGYIFLFIGLSIFVVDFIKDKEYYFEKYNYDEDQMCFYIGKKLVNKIELTQEVTFCVKKPGKKLIEIKKDSFIKEIPYEKELYNILNSKCISGD